MSGSGRCPAGCGRAVLWALSPAGRNMPLNPVPDPRGTWIPIAGRAYTRAALVVRGEPWAGWADAPAHVAHPATCPLWPRADAEKAAGSAQGHLACMACGTVDATVRHCPEGDRCRDCRRPEHVEPPSTSDQEVPA